MNSPTLREDHRHFTRIPFQSQVHLVGAGGEWYCTLLDISLRGVLIAKPENWHSNTEDKFLVEILLNSSTIQIRMEVSVVHIEDDHVGFRCEHIDLDSITHLRRLVELNIGNTEILNRELTALGNELN